MSQPIVAVHQLAHVIFKAIIAIAVGFVFLTGFAVGRGSAEVKNHSIIRPIMLPLGSEAEPAYVVQQASVDAPPRSIESMPGRTILVAPAFSSGPGIHISWETAEDDGARVVEVLAACEAQLQDQQASPQANDSKARAMALVNQAIQLLNGHEPKPGEIR